MYYFCYVVICFVLFVWFSWGESYSAEFCRLLGLKSPIVVCNSAVAGPQPGLEKEEGNTPKTYWKISKLFVRSTDVFSDSSKPILVTDSSKPIKSVEADSGNYAMWKKSKKRKAFLSVDLTHLALNLA